MRPTTHLLASLAMTALAVGCAFVLPMRAEAAGVKVAMDDDEKAAAEGAAPAATRPLGAFTHLRIDGAIDVDARPGAHPSATVHASKRIEPLIETVVEGDTLVVRMKHNVNVITLGHDSTRVDVEFTQLDTTQQRGSGDLRIHGLNSAKLQSSIAGSGDLKVDDAQIGSLALRIEGSGDAAFSGKAEEARFSIDGSGDVTADKLVARRVAVEIHGSGDARVNATDALEARIAGSGDVVYRGHPHAVARDVAGSGSVSSAD